MLPSPINGGDSSATAFHPFGHHRPSPPPSRTMEEVWKDINLHEINVPRHNPASCYTAPSSSPSLILQDFLHRTSAAAAAAVPSVHSSPPPPATVLNLNSGPKFYSPTDDFRDDDSPSGHRVSDGDDGCHLGPFDALASSFLASFGKKRLLEGSNGDRRHKRMMKNRESAARSRARKQAYINGLQLKIDHLKEENDKLKEQQKKLMLLQAEPVLQQLPKKHLLQRTSTAPF